MLRFMLCWIMFTCLVAMDAEKKPFEAHVKHPKKMRFIRPDLG